MFCSMFEHNLQAKLLVFMVPMNSTWLQLTNCFPLFHSKFDMPPKSKVVSLEKLDNFILGGLKYLGEICRTRQKFREGLKDNRGFD
jgi:hypothetical protein